MKWYIVLSHFYCFRIYFHYLQVKILQCFHSHFKRYIFVILLLTVWSALLNWFSVPFLTLIITIFLCSPLACKGEFDVSSTRTILLIGDLLFEIRLDEFFLKNFSHWISWARFLSFLFFSRLILKMVWITYITIFVSVKLYTI